jgi:serine/threonine protein kinase
MKKNKKALKLNEYSLETIIGEGTFGKVKLARRKKDGKIVCVKIMKKAVIIETRQINHILNEIEILSQLKHTMIVSYFLRYR